MCSPEQSNGTNHLGLCAVQNTVTDQLGPGGESRLTAATPTDDPYA